MYNQKKAKKIARDEIFNTIEFAVQSENFLRKFEFYQTLVLRFTNENLLTEAKDIIKESFLHPELAQVVSYDTTFLMGDFYVSSLVCRNIKLEGDPIFPVAFLVHERKHMRCHKEFFLDI